MYYKVVNRVKGKLYSAIISSKAKVKYESSKWVTANKWSDPGYGLLAFDTFNNAATFARLNTGIVLNLEVWCCHCEDVRTGSSVPPMLYYSTNKDRLISLWRDWPSGTVMAHRIKLIKPVWCHGKAPYVVTCSTCRYCFNYNRGYKYNTGGSVNLLCEKGHYDLYGEEVPPLSDFFQAKRSCLDFEPVEINIDKIKEALDD